jgi:hypothetical protein
MTKEAAEKKKYAENTVSEDFDKLTLKAIDEALSALGEQSKTAIYFYLNGKYHVKKREIPQRIEDFSKALEDVLKTGAVPLEILCMDNLFAQVKKACGWSICEWTAPKLTFNQYVQFMRQQYKEGKNETE